MALAFNSFCELGQCRKISIGEGKCHYLRRVNRLHNNARLSAPRCSERAWGRFSGPTLKDGLIFDNKDLILLGLSENLGVGAGETVGMSGVTVLSSVVIEMSKQLLKPLILLCP